MSGLSLSKVKLPEKAALWKAIILKLVHNSAAPLLHKSGPRRSVYGTDHGLRPHCLLVTLQPSMMLAKAQKLLTPAPCGQGSCLCMNLLVVPIPWAGIAKEVTASSPPALLPPLNHGQWGLRQLGMGTGMLLNGHQIQANSRGLEPQSPYKWSTAVTILSVSNNRAPGHLVSLMTIFLPHFWCLHSRRLVSWKVKQNWKQICMYTLAVEPHQTSRCHTGRGNMPHSHYQSCTSLQWLWIKALLFPFLAMPAEAKDLKDVTFKNTQTRTTRKWKAQQQELEFRITERPHWGGIHCREEQKEMFRCLRKINAKIDRHQWEQLCPLLCSQLSLSTTARAA